jgi:8-oxo-dGTP diphosphatase
MKLLNNLLLLCIAFLLSPLLVVGMLYAFLSYLFSFRFKKYWNKVSTYFRSCAIAIDQLGNVFCAELFNDLLIKDDSTPFGDEDETISSVLGKNQQKNNLTKLGIALNALLDFIDTNHSLNSIEQDEQI